MVIDCVKGVEIQTEKLMEVCRMRNTPVICFINKLDREGRDPFDLLDEIEEKLNIKVRPLSWPINMGKAFKGVYSLYEKSLHLFTGSKITIEEGIEITNINDKTVDDYVGENNAAQLRADVELIEGVYPDFNVDDYLSGKVAPVFFGSAVNNFGVKELLDTFIRIALRFVLLNRRKTSSLDLFLRSMQTWIRSTGIVLRFCGSARVSLNAEATTIMCVTRRAFASRMQLPSWRRIVRQ
jgi:peptide subunit release factor RF-3